MDEEQSSPAVRRAVAFMRLLLAGVPRAEAKLLARNPVVVETLNEPDKGAQA